MDAIPQRYFRGGNRPCRQGCYRTVCDGCALDCTTSRLFAILNAAGLYDFWFSPAAILARIRKSSPYWRAFFYRPRR
nr:hypothetical protein [uncultured bacterium]